MHVRALCGRTYVCVFAEGKLDHIKNLRNTKMTANKHNEKTTLFMQLKCNIRLVLFLLYIMLEDPALKKAL